MWAPFVDYEIDSMYRYYIGLFLKLEYDPKKQMVGKRNQPILVFVLCAAMVAVTLFPFQSPNSTKAIWVSQMSKSQRSDA